LSSFKQSCPFCGNTILLKEFDKHLLSCPKRINITDLLGPPAPQPKMSVHDYLPEELREPEPTERFILKPYIQEDIISPSDPVLPVRPYQTDAVNAWMKNNYKGIITLPTGLGKSRIPMEAYKQLGGIAGAGNLLILVPKKAIVETTWFPQLRTYLGATSIGSFYESKNDIRPVTVGLYQTAIRKPWVLRNFNFIVFDEVHHLAAPEFGKLVNHLAHAKYLMGLSIKVSRRNPAMWKILQVIPRVYRMSIKQAMKEGWLPPLHVHPVIVTMNNAELAAYNEFTEKIRKAYAHLGVDMRFWEAIAAKGGAYAMWAKVGLSAFAGRRKLLSMLDSKLEPVKKIVELHPKQKILLFSEGIEGITKISKYLAKQDVHSLLYHSKMSETAKKQNLRNMWGRSSNLLLSVTALEEGVDIPEVKVGIFHSSGQADQKVGQRLGRIMRLIVDRKPNSPRWGLAILGSDGKPIPAHAYVLYVPNTTEEKVKNRLIRIHEETEED